MIRLPCGFACILLLLVHFTACTDSFNPTSCYTCRGRVSPGSYAYTSMVPNRGTDIVMSSLAHDSARATTMVTPSASTKSPTPGTLDRTEKTGVFPHLGKNIMKGLGALLLVSPFVLGGGLSVNADDELAKYAAEGNKVGVDGECFFKKCALETTSCANDPNCLKGLSCLARCKGGSMCSTGCFAKYGSKQLDNLLSCSVEKNDCVHVPGNAIESGWSPDTLAELPAKPASSFDMGSLDGNWYKVMGLDSRYDCFDCQKNSFQKKNTDTLKMEAMFRIPRPSAPGYLQNRIVEELHKVDIKTARAANLARAQDKTVADSIQIPHMQSRGEMFGLTFWENWYVMGESRPVTGPLGIPSALAAASKGESFDGGAPEMKLIFYTGHTLQGSYKGSFLYSRSREMSPAALKQAAEIIKRAGLNPNDFCIVRNQCFLNDKPGSSSSAGATNLASANKDDSAPYWFLGQNFFKATKSVATELADWFEDPAIVSDWLVSQQEHMVLEQPLQVSPFASLSE
mmetsp:Transcript_25172/g.42126  ORF Transcript_25172/g.42126 Transcript_25172/m.42126 type:complete len:513 (-) Transcript_25172:408-1946(-)